MASAPASACADSRAADQKHAGSRMRGPTPGKNQQVHCRPLTLAPPAHRPFDLWRQESKASRKKSKGRFRAAFGTNTNRSLEAMASRYGEGIYAPIRIVESSLATL